MLRTLVATALSLIATTASAQAVHAPGAGIPTQTWPAGTVLADIPHGGRITTFHRGLLYLGGTGTQRTWVYDISNPTSPQLRCDWTGEDNSHVWYKFGDLFYRQNLAFWTQTPPTLTSLAGFAAPSTCPATRQNYTAPAIHDFPLASTIPGDDWMATYPYAFNYRVLDSRTGGTVSMRNLWDEKGVTSTNRFRIGNLLFFTPGDTQTGIAVFDIADPANPVLLDTLTGNFKQYTTTWQVWRHYLVMVHGDAENGPDANANALVIDFSNPSDLRVAWTIPLTDMPGRYVHFQDQYAFAGHKTMGGVKYDMTTRQVVRRFPHPVSVWEWFTDFQWIPLGHVLLVSGSEPNSSRSFLFTHQDGRDTTPPTIGHHLPADGALNVPLKSAIGLVINEQLDSTTVNDQTIQLRALGGEPLPAVVSHTSYDVVNLVPVAPLQANTTYEVRLVANGLRDVAGNGVVAKSFFFSTGSSLQTAPVIDSLAITPAATAGAPRRAGQSLAFAATTRNATEYRWDYGDGNSTTWTNSASSNHAYATPGIYVAQLQVRNAFSTASATQRLVINPTVSATPPAASGSIVVDAPGRRVWVVNPDHGSVAVFDADTRQRVGLHAACAEPRGLARDASGRTWVACHGDDRLVALAADGTVAAQLATGYGSAPTALLFDATGNVGYATLEGTGEVVKFDANAATETARVALGFAAESLARAGGRLYAARLKSPNAAGQVRTVALSSFTVVDDVALPIDTISPDSGTAGRGLPNYVASLAVSPDAARVWYAAKKDNVLRGLARDGVALNFETTVRVMVGAIDTASATEAVPQRRDLDDSSLALAMAPSPGGALLFVALAGNDRVVAIDPWRGGEFARAETGAAPRGLAVDPVAQRLWVRNDVGRSVSVYDVASLSVEGANAMTNLGTESTVAGEVLAPQVLAGKRLFYRANDTRISADGYIACASCHLDGGSDGRVWDFTQRGEGLRRTQSLQGRAGMGHGPLHWSGNFDEVQDFEHDIRNEFSGSGLMSNAHFFTGTRDEPLGDAKAGVSADLDALAAYVTSLDDVGRSPLRGGLALDATGEVGRTVFQSIGCSGCHGGAAFTDSARLRSHDVGTVAAGDLRLGQPLQGFDTPTLRGLWKESTLLHDGRADDLLDALVANDPDGRHGAVAGLSTAQRDALTRYLGSIDDNEPAAPAPFTLTLASPVGTVDPAQPMRVAIDSNANVVRLDVLVDGVVAGTRTTAPWQVDVPVAAGARPMVQLRVTHASGAVTYTWPKQVVVGTVAGELFKDGFENP